MFLNQSLLSLGESAPTFRLLDHQGHSVGLEDFASCRGVVLVFFASNWLKTDLQLLQLYMDAYPEFQKQNIQVLALSGINWETLHYLGKQLSVPFPLIFDPCCRYAKKYRSMLIPKFVTGRAVYGLTREQHVIFADKGVVSPQKVLAAFNS